MGKPTVSDTLDVLIIGLSGSGKSLLRRQLVQLAKLHSFNARNCTRECSAAKTSTTSSSNNSDSLYHETEVKEGSRFLSVGKILPICCCCFCGNTNDDTTVDQVSSSEFHADPYVVRSKSAKERDAEDHSIPPESCHVESKSETTTSKRYNCFTQLIHQMKSPQLSNLYPTLGVELDEFNCCASSELNSRMEGSRLQPKRRSRRADRHSRKLNCLVRIREVGGMMRPLWESYYKDCTKVIFVVDISDYLTIFNAGSAIMYSKTFRMLSFVEACDSFKHNDLSNLINECDLGLALKESMCSLQNSNRNATFLVALNKIDVSAPLPSEDVREALQIELLQKKLLQNSPENDESISIENENVNKCGAFADVKVMRTSALRGTGLDDVLAWILLDKGNDNKDSRNISGHV